MKIAILSGPGPYADPWHDFTGTSAAAARALEPLGLEVTVLALEPDAVVDVVPGCDLVVVNAGGGDPDAPQEIDASWDDAFRVLRDHRAARRSVLGLHMGANTLRGLDEWSRWIGGRWVPGRSMHPPIGDARVEVTDPEHPITVGLAPFTTVDERYCDLDRSPAAHVLLHHDHEGGQEPLAWAIEQDGARAVYDALGHDVRAYASPERVDLLRREVRWLLEPAGPVA